MMIMIISVISAQSKNSLHGKSKIEDITFPNYPINFVSVNH